LGLAAIKLQKKKKEIFLAAHGTREAVGGKGFGRVRAGRWRELEGKRPVTL